jgi:hypothetical protein
VPKAARNRFVLAKDESSGKPLLERIKISNLHRFKDVGKPRPAYKPRTTPYTPVPGRRERLAREADLNDFKHQLQLEDYRNEQRKRRLLDRIANAPPPLPLIERIEPPPTPPIEVKPIPKDLRFHTNTQVHQLRDYGRKFNGALNHLGPFFQKLDEQRFRVGLTEHELYILGLFKERFDNIRKHLQTIVETKEYTTREWKKISRDLKKAGAHSFAELKPRFAEHCRELIQELGEDWLFLEKNLD